MPLPDPMQQQLQRGSERLRTAIEEIESELNRIAQRISEEQARDGAFPQTLTTNDRLAILEKLGKAEGFLHEAANAETPEDARLLVIGAEGTVIAASAQVTGERGELSREATLAAIRLRDKQRREQRLEAIVAITSMVATVASVVGGVSDQIGTLVSSVSAMITGDGPNGGDSNGSQDDDPGSD